MPQSRRVERAPYTGIIIQWPPGTPHVFSFGAGLPGLLALRPGGGQGWEGESGTPNPAAFLHATGKPHLHSEGRGERRLGPCGVGLGTLAPEGALSRGWCCPSPSGSLTQPDKPMSPSPGWWVRERNVPRTQGPEHPAGALSCRGAEPPPASQAPWPYSRLLVNLSAGTAPVADAEPTAPSSGPGLSLAHPTSSWGLLQYRVLALRGRIGPVTMIGVLPELGRHGQEGRQRQLRSTSFSKKAPSPPRLRLVASSPRTAEQGRDGWGRFGFEEGIL